MARDNPTLHLTRHFFSQIFDSETAAPGQWSRVIIGIVATILPMSLLFLPMFWYRYKCVEAGEPVRGCPAISDYHGLYLQLVQTDSLWLVSLAIVVTALATSLRWQSLFPSRRDCLALAGLPISMRQVFFARCAGVVVAFLAFVVGLNFPTAALFATVSAGRWQTHPIFGPIFVSCALASAFAFFTLIALQGLLLNILPSRWFERVSSSVQAALFTLSVAALPFLWRTPTTSRWYPPNWFYPRPLAEVAAIPLAAALVLYLISYHRYRRLLLEQPLRRESRGWWGSLGSRILDRWIRDPREQAVFGFIGKTLLRSRSHRLVLQIAAGLGLACVAQGILTSARSHTTGRVDLEMAAVYGPLVMSVLAVTGLRYLFALPTELGANWIFRTTDAAGREAWLRGVDRFVITFAIVPPYLIVLPAGIAAFGMWGALRVAALGFFVALAIFEFLFRDWRKAPHTCSYIPGKRPLWQIGIVGLQALGALALVSGILIGLSRSPVLFIAGIPIPIGAWRELRRRRMASREGEQLIYEESGDPAVATLSIGFERGSVPSLTTETAPPERQLFRLMSEEPRIDWSQFSAGMLFRGAGEDLRYALRAMLKNPGLSIVVLITLAFGIGLNASVFTLLNSLAFRAHVPDADSFFRAYQYHTPPARNWMKPDPVPVRTSAAEYKAFRANTHAARSVTAWSPMPVNFDDDLMNTARALLVSCNFFEVYGERQARLGRLLREGDCAESSAAPPIVISEESWRSRFNSDAAIIGQTVQLNRREVQIVGVAPAGSPARQNRLSAWLPYTAREYFHFRIPRDGGWLMLEGRLAGGATRSAVAEEFAGLTHDTFSVTDGSWIAHLREDTNNLAKFAWLLTLMGASVGSVLLITCGNTATLLLSRAVSRRREMSVRLAVGAPRVRLVRLLLMETLMMAGGSGVLALAIAGRVPDWLYRFVLRETPDFPIVPDWRVFGFIAAAALAAGCLAGLAPVIESLRVDLAGALRGYDAMIGNITSGTRLRTLLVSSQVALSLMLMVGAGLMLQAHYRWQHRDVGFDPKQTIVVAVPSKDAAALEPLITALRGLPRVRSAGPTFLLPWVPNIDTGRTILLVQCTGDPETLYAPIRDAVKRLQPGWRVTPRVADWWRDQNDTIETRFVGLAMSLALIAMLLAVAGIYGVLAFVVRRSTRDLAVRVALGAQKQDIVREVLTGGAKPVAYGLFFGLWLAIGADAWLRHQFAGAPFTVDSGNPAVYLGAASVLLAVSLGAMLIPARRAAEAEPADVLRGE
jgi:ABC-type lipoprotein release transport system permease subunit